MISLPRNVEPLVNELLQVLDTEIELLDLRCGQFSRLTQASIERDDQVLHDLLEEIEATQQDQQETDMRLQALRQTLATALGLTEKKLRLAWLIRQMPPEQASAIQHRRRQIIVLTDRIKRQHMETALVVSECARVNRLLLENLFPQAQTVTTYGARGESSRSQGSGLLDLES